MAKLFGTTESSCKMEHKFFDNFDNKEKKISFLIFRTDKIGDTVLSLPVAEAIKKTYKNSKITFVIKSFVAPLFENNPFVDELILIDKTSSHDFVKKIRNKFDVSISLFVDKTSSLYPFLAKIPMRVGPFSKIWSLFLNTRIIQNRSKCLKSEAEYNLELLASVGIQNFNGFFSKIFITENEILETKNFLKSKNIFETDKLILIHPGSGGSSKDWPISKFLELIKLLTKTDLKILTTGNRTELAKYKKILKNKGIDSKFLLDEELDLRKFLGLISRANLFISNSTGPLHLASALGIKTVSFFPPIKACSPRRWQPFSKNPSNNFVFSPKISKHDCKKCERNCEYFLCMDLIDEKDVFTKIFEMLKEG